MKNLFFISQLVVALVFFASCEQESINETTQPTDIEALAETVQNSQMNLEGIMETYQSLSEKELTQFVESLTKQESESYTQDTKFRKSVLAKSQELFGKPFNQLTYEQEEQVFSQVEAFVDLNNELYLESPEEFFQLEEDLTKEAEPSWCVSYEFPEYLNRTHSPDIQWAFWSFVSRIENNVASGDCDVRFIFYTNLNALDADNYFGRTARMSGSQTWHFVGLGRLNWWFGGDSANWPRNMGEVY